MNYMNSFIYIVDESPLIKVKTDLCYPLPMIFVKREGNRRVEQHQYDQHDTYKLYGVELLWPLVCYSPQYSETQWVIYSDRQNQLSVMYAN